MFLSSVNLVNLTLDSAAVGVISLGIVFVLLVGEIDLSVGSVSGFSAAIAGVLFVRHSVPLGLAMLAACAVAVADRPALRRAADQVRDAQLRGVAVRVCSPSWACSCAILGDQGSINLPFDSTLVFFAQLAFLPAWLSYVLAAVFAADLPGRPGWPCAGGARGPTSRRSRWG